MYRCIKKNNRKEGINVVKHLWKEKREKYEKKSLETQTAYNIKCSLGGVDVEGDFGVDFFINTFPLYFLCLFHFRSMFYDF